jgi:glycopeptide antibiotics resistance protein
MTAATCPVLVPPPNSEFTQSMDEHHSASSSPNSAWTDERICLLAAVGVAVGIIYGSLVPFDLRMSDALSPAAWLEQLRFAPWRDFSRTDLFVNIAVGVPFGFFLMGALRSTRPSHVAAAAALLMVGCLSAILGTAVEMLQVLSPTRNSSWNDILAQGFGAVVGAVTWTRTGAAVRLWLRQLATEREPWAFTSRLVQLYLPIYLFLQFTPFDSLRPAEIAAKYGEGLVTLVPSPPSESIVLVSQNFVGNAILSIPIGMFAVLGWVRRDRRIALWRAVLLGISMVSAVGIAQELTWRHSGLRDLLAATLGVMIGIAAAKRLARPRRSDPIDQPRRIHPWFLVAAAVWTLALLWYSWYPFEFELTSEIVKRRLTRIPLVPFAFYYLYASYRVNPFQAVHEILVNFLLAVPLGLLLRLTWPVARDQRVRRLQVVIITLAVTAVLLGIELGQMFLPLRFPDVTDVLMGAVAAMLGCATGTAVAAGGTSGGIPAVAGSETGVRGWSCEERA